MGSLTFYNFYQSSNDFVNLIITKKRLFKCNEFKLVIYSPCSHLSSFGCFSTTFIGWQLYLVTLNKLQTEHFYFFHRILFCVPVFLRILTEAKKISCYIFKDLLFCYKDELSTRWSVQLNRCVSKHTDRFRLISG